MIIARPWMAWIAFVFAALLAVAGPAAADVIELSPGTGELALSSHVTYLHDTDGRDTVQDAWARIVKSKTQQLW